MDVWTSILVILGGCYILYALLVFLFIDAPTFAQRLRVAFLFPLAVALLFLTFGLLPLGFPDLDDDH